MFNSRLVFEEACVYLITYIVYILSFVVFTYYFGEYTTSLYNNHFKKKQTISDSDLNYLNSNFGNNAELIEGLGNVINFFNSFIPSNILILIFLAVPYLFQFFLLHSIERKKTNRNDYKVYMSNAVTSITSAIGSLMFFITSILIIGVFYIGFGLEMWGSSLMGFFFIMSLIYVAITFIFFFMDKKIPSILKKAIL